MVGRGKSSPKALRTLYDGTRDAIGLVVPETCLVCGRSGPLCRGCKEDLQRPPVRFSPRAPLRAPAWACGPYAGARRHLILSAKERGSREARRIMGAVFAAAVRRLAAEGHILPPEITPIVFIPAPTRNSSRRRRGGDPVTIACEFAASQLGRAEVLPLVCVSERARDSAELGAAQRRKNLSGRIVPTAKYSHGIGDDLRKRCRDATVVLVDDVATTGATAAETELVAASLGIRVDMVLVLARA